MFYVSSYKDGLIGVTDSKDGVEEFYTSEFLSNIGVEIIRFNKELEVGYTFKTKCFKFTLVDEDNIIGWKLKALEGVDTFKNKASYLGYPVISLDECFINCESNNLNLRGMDTSNVTDMGSMFSKCKSLTTLDLSNFNTSNVVDMHGMFHNCESLITLDLGNFDTSNVTNMSGMFWSCESLTTLDLGNFNASNVTNMSGMFWNCKSLATLDLGNFNASNVTDMSCIFWGCHNLVMLHTFDKRIFNNCDAGIKLVPKSLGVSYDKLVKSKEEVARYLLFGFKGIIAYEN